MFARRPYTNPGSCILRDFRSAKVAVIKYRVVKMACHSHKDSARTLHLDRSRLRNASRASTERGARCNERLKKKTEVEHRDQIRKPDMFPHLSSKVRSRIDVPDARRRVARVIDNSACRLQKSGREKPSLTPAKKLFCSGSVEVSG